MSYEATGLTTLYPIYLARRPQKDENVFEADSAIAQNETRLNLDLTALYNKLTELEEALSALSEQVETP